MKINVTINKQISEPILTIETPELTNDIKHILLYLDTNKDNSVLGYLNDEIYILNKQEIENIFTEGNYVFAYSNNEKYQLKNRLYFYEELLKDTFFIRISNSELINLRKVKKLNFSFKGSILITLDSGRQTYCSRRKIKDIKKALNVN